MHFLKSQKAQAAALILSAITLETLSAFFYYFTHPTPFLEALYYTSQISSSIFVISGVVIAIWQYYLSSQNAKTNLEILQVQRAIDLSEYYKDHILNCFPAVYYVFNHTGVSEIINCIHFNQLIDFDIYELNRLFTSSQIKQLKEIQESEYFTKRILEACTIYNLDLNKYHFKTTLGNSSTGKYYTNVIWLFQKWYQRKKSRILPALYDRNRSNHLEP